MNQTHGFLHYASPVRGAAPGFWHWAAWAVRLCSLLFSGAFLGYFAVIWLAQPLWIAEGTVALSSPSSSAHSPSTAISQQNWPNIVSTALKLARGYPAGASLPVSATVALKASVYSPQNWPSRVSISYTDPDPTAADLMESALIKSYIAAQGQAWGAAPAQASYFQSAPDLLQRRSLDNLGALAGSFVGLLVFIVWVRHRRKRQNLNV